ncbi:MAG: hypothetical protein IH984_11655 [Planctomycetes bacterium]|nr:hypothetical protein [Planctomycetota bacterium]
MTGWKRHIVFVLGVVAAAAACVAAISFTISPRGTIGPTLLQAQSPAAAVIAVSLGLMGATIVGAIVGRLTNALVGLFIVGAGLGALAFRFGSIGDLAFANGSLMFLAVETVIFSVLVLLSTYVVYKIAGPLEDIDPPEDDYNKTKSLFLSAAAALIMLPIVWFIATSELRGQTLAATFFGCMLAGLASRLIAPNTQPKLIFATACLVGAVGHVYGAYVVGTNIESAFIQETIPALSMPLPIDYAAGALMGVSMGLGWARSFLHHEQDETSQASAASVPQKL